MRRIFESFALGLFMAALCASPALANVLGTNSGTARVIVASGGEGAVNLPSTLDSLPAFAARGARATLAISIRAIST